MTKPGERLSRLLVATDFSDSAAAAVARAARLPLAAGARLTLFHVVPADAPDLVEAKAHAGAREQLRQAGQALRKAAQTSGGELPVVVEEVVGLGRPFVEIIRKARLLDAELVVLGRHGARPMRDLLLGTTAKRVVRMGSTPTLVVGGKPAGPYRSPLLATDLEDDSLDVISLARKVLGDAFTANLLHVTDAADSWSRAEAERGMASLLALRGGAGLVLRPLYREGGTGWAILEQARLQAADLIVMGTHGRAGLAHVLLGSVAEYVLEGASCDLLVARPVPFSFELP